MAYRPHIPSPDRRAVLRGSLAASAALTLPVAAAAARLRPVRPAARGLGRSGG